MILFPGTERETMIRALNDTHAREIKDAIFQAFNEGLKYELAPRASQPEDKP